MSNFASQNTCSLHGWASPMGGSMVGKISVWAIILLVLTLRKFHAICWCHTFAVGHDTKTVK